VYHVDPMSSDEVKLLTQAVELEAYNLCLNGCLSYYYGLIHLSSLVKPSQQNFQ
jgi:hypothetical protein